MIFLMAFVPVISIYLPGLRVTRWCAIIKSVGLQCFLVCLLRALGISQASLDEIRFLPLLKDFHSLFFTACEEARGKLHSSKNNSRVRKLRCNIFLECNYKKRKAYNYQGIDLKDSIKLTILRREWEESVKQTSSLLKSNKDIMSIAMKAMIFFLQKDGHEIYTYAVTPSFQIEALNSNYSVQHQKPKRFLFVPICSLTWLVVGFLFHVFVL